MSSLRGRLVGLFVAGVLLLNFPLLSLFDRPVSVGGVPLLYVSIFGVWILLIATTATLMNRPGE
jgi:hypothetical protein